MNVHCSSEALSSVRFRNPAVGLIQTVLIIDAASNQLPSAPSPHLLKLQQQLKQENLHLPVHK